MTHTALLTLAHGSRHPKAGHGVRALTAAAGRRLGLPDDAVRLAHLDLDVPLLDDVARSLAADGFGRAAVVPLLFSTAFHAKVDVPAAVTQAAAESGLELRLAPGIGLGGDLLDVLVGVVGQDARRGAHVVLYPVGSSHEEANREVRRLGERLAARTGHAVTTIPATGGAGAGGAGIIECAVAHRGEGLHLLPLFVTHGLLLDKVMDQLPFIERSTGCACTASGPLTRALAPIVAERYRAAEAGAVDSRR